MKVVFPRLYAIIDADLLRRGRREASRAREEVAVAVALAESGIELIQYRDKTASPRELFSSARELADALRPAGVRFIVNDRADVAATARAGGVHVGQQDLPPRDARAMCPPPMWVGVSTHTLEQVEAVAQSSADYIVVGRPVVAAADPKAAVRQMHEDIAVQVVTL